MLSMKKGFTLIELMVSVAIFSMVMVVALGALLSISAQERKAETLKTVMTNLDFALDSMSRSIRTGLNYQCNPSLPIAGVPTATDCPGGSYIIAFQAVAGSLPSCLPNANCIVVYCRGTGSTCSSSGTTVLRSINNGPFYPITTTEIQIANLMFYVKGAPRSEGFQPKVTISMNGYIPLSGNATSEASCLAPGSSGSAQCSAFNIETSVTQRLYDQ